MKLVNKLKDIIGLVKKDGKKRGIYCSTMKDYNNCLDLLESSGIRWRSDSSATTFKNKYWQPGLKTITLPYYFDRVIIGMSDKESATIYELFRYSDLKNIESIY